MIRHSAALLAILSMVGCAALPPGDPQCPGVWLPPPQYDHKPTTNPVIHLPADVDYACRQFGVKSVRAISACNGWKDQKWHVFLDPARSPAQLKCDFRHESGHENERRATGNDNPWHDGWHLG